VYLASEKAVVDLDPARVDLSTIRKAVASAGYQVPDEFEAARTATPLENFTRPILALLGVVFGAVLFIIVVGEWLGFFEAVTSRAFRSS
jgi:Cd2+/Zn2+-exporting ATPase/Cu+-exporting ATPase